MKKARNLTFASLAVLVVASAIAGEPAGPAGAPLSPNPYVPGLGEFMNSAIQPHHIKLWFAAASGDWPLAAYEAGELRETFDDVVTYQGDWHQLPIGNLVRATVEPALKLIDSAIEAKDVTQFRREYVKLNAACNSCHMSAAHGFVRIDVPATNPFSDQRFDDMRLANRH